MASPLFHSWIGCTLVAGWFVACSDGGGAAAPAPRPATTGITDGGAVPADGGSVAPALDCIGQLGAGDRVVTCEGLAHDVHVPEACTKGGCGIILDIHGATMSGRMEDNNSNMRAIGDREGFVVVQPNAQGSVPITSWDPANYELVWAFFGAVRRTLQIDPKRVHVMGFSQGGMMTFAFVCGHGDEIASAAPGAGSGCTAAELGAVKRQVPLLVLDGRHDALWSFGDALARNGAIATAWAMGAPAAVRGDTQYTWTRYENAGGTVLEVIEHGYTASASLLGGHCYPGSTDAASVPGQVFSFACTPPNAFLWGEEVMTFFKAHPMR